MKNNMSECHRHLKLALSPPWVAEVTVMQGDIKYTLIMLSKHLNLYTCVKYFRNIPFGYFKFIPSLLPQCKGYFGTHSTFKKSAPVFHFHVWCTAAGATFICPITGAGSPPEPDLTLCLCHGVWEEAGREADVDTMGGLCSGRGLGGWGSPGCGQTGPARQHDRWLCLRVPGWGLNLRHFVYPE